MNTLTRVEKYVQLVLAKDSDLWEDMCYNGYEALGDYYTLGDDDTERCIEIDYVAKTNLVSMIGREGRCYTVEARTVFVAKDGTVWLNSDDAYYFC
jgi:hypothetical protein